MRLGLFEAGADGHTRQEEVMANTPREEAGRKSPGLPDLVGEMTESGTQGKAKGALARERAETVPLLGTPQGQALAKQQVEVVAENGGAWLFAPVSSRGEAVGILELWLDERPDEPTIASVAGAAHALAYIVIANRRFTDLFDWGQRSVPLSLEAEIQHRLLPGSYTCEAGQFTLAGWLEPAGDVAGDTFDFSLERDILHLSMTDAMGHTLRLLLLRRLSLE